MMAVENKGCSIELCPFTEPDNIPFVPDGLLKHLCQT